MSDTQKPTIAAIPPKPDGFPVDTTQQHAPDSKPASTLEASPSDAVTEESSVSPPDTSKDAALAQLLANQEERSYQVATASSPWQYDDVTEHCSNCHAHFDLLNRKHHCRLCGNIFCHNCSSNKALIPPSKIVLAPSGGKKVPSNALAPVSFSPDTDPDRMLTYVNTNNDLLYGKGLEERFQLAREPIRVCNKCHTSLLPLQDELKLHNSHAVKYNYIDPTDIRRLFNSPLAFTLGHEIRKAAFALNNLLPQPRRRPGAIVSHYTMYDHDNNNNNPVQNCKDTCLDLSPNLGDLDGVKIPAKLLEQAKGIAVLTVLKGGFGVAGFEFGTGLAVARLANPDGSSRWSPPTAIGLAGLAWGALVGAQVSDHVFLCMTDAAVQLLFSERSVQLGADVGVAVGPLGRAVEGDWGVAQTAAPIYTYSLSKGLYFGVSLDGKILSSRPNVNEKFYGGPVTAQQILAGAVPTPPAAQPLYEALQRCHVYAAAASATSVTQTLTQAVAPSSLSTATSGLLPPEESRELRNEYGEVVPPTTGTTGVHDQYSVGTGMSDVTLDTL